VEIGKGPSQRGDVMRISLSDGGIEDAGIEGLTYYYEVGPTSLWDDDTIQTLDELGWGNIGGGP
jgi:hypothetical protein